MEPNEIKSLNSLRKLTARYCTTLNPSPDKKEFYTAKIELLNYYELGCIITNMLKLCILALENESHKISETDKKAPINVSLILETVLEMFPMDEFEMLSEINEILVGDFQGVDE
ncbi:hypothetical protein [Flavobacterium aquidurense]|uniref:Uncharacterized protein n=1 Tax=Flavobacterium aquidurense TaxID=362413 RepID=A0A0Q0SAY0_9FLAO|nr:hypothetical protein [Flavobacterium aquidurense]KQB41159.1 hypothetical protein RC62_4535 [Flavobacterium aquidurense]